MSESGAFEAPLSRRGARAAAHPFLSWIALAVDKGSTLSGKETTGCCLVATSSISRSLGFGADAMGRPVLSVPSVDVSAFISMRWVGACFFLDAPMPGVTLKTFVTAQLAHQHTDLGDWLLLVGALEKPLDNPTKVPEVSSIIEVWLPAASGVIEDVLTEAFGDRVPDITAAAGVELRLTAHYVTAAGAVPIAQNDIASLSMMVCRHQVCEVPQPFKPARYSFGG